MADITIDPKVRDTSPSTNGHGNSPLPPQAFEPQDESEHIGQPVVGPRVPLKAASEDGESEREDAPDEERHTGDVLNPRELDIVHETLKGADVGFGYDISALDREAKEQARMWADAGLPRHDLDHDSPIEAEVLLARRAGEIYARWIRRVRRKVDAAISAQRIALDDALADGWRALDGYRSARRALDELAPRSREPEASASIERAAAEPTHVAIATGDITSSADATPPLTAVGPGTQPSEIQLARREFGRSFWILSICLVLAEFIANAPVFTELFPLNVDVDRRVTDFLAASEIHIVLLGGFDVLIKLLAAPEPAFLALSVVTFFLFLGHRLGEALRAIVALWPGHPDIAVELTRRVRRQAYFAATACACGVVIMLVVLFSIRAKVLPLAEDRLARATAQAEIATAELKANDSRERIPVLRDAAWQASDERVRRLARRDYAASIAGANLPILGMNLVLVIVAIVAGFFRRELTLETMARPAEPLASEPQMTAAGANPMEELGKLAEADKTVSSERLRELRDVLTSEQQRLTRCIADAELALARSTQLIHCNPTAQSEGIASRLASVIPAFRAHNALLRRLDPVDIKAFRRPASVNLEPARDTSRSPELLRLLEEQRERIDTVREAARNIGTPARNDRRSSNVTLVEDES